MKKKKEKWFKTRMDISNVIIRLTCVMSLEYMGFMLPIYQRVLLWAGAGYLFLDTLLRIFGNQPLVESEQNLMAQREIKKWKRK